MNPLYEVIVGNIGTVFASSNPKDASEALRIFREYVESSKSGVGRAGNEPVTLFYDGEIDDEYNPPDVLAQEES
jgi:hypothetical protein